MALIRRFAPIHRPGAQSQVGLLDAAECCELTWNYSHLAAVMLSFAFARRVVLRKASKAETCMQAQNYGDDGY